MILDAWGWCTGTTQRDGMGREDGGGFRMGNDIFKRKQNHIFSISRVVVHLRVSNIFWTFP